MMNREEYRNILSPVGCLSESAIEWFIEGTLNAEEMQAVLSHAKTCQLCSDALAGAKNFVSSKQYTSAVHRMKHSAFRKSLEQDQNTRTIFLTISAIAASILILVGTFYIFQTGQEIKKNGILLEKQEISSLSESNKSDLPVDFKKIEEVKTESDEYLQKKQNSKKIKVAVPEAEIQYFSAPLVLESPASASSEIIVEEESINEIVVTKNIDAEPFASEADESEPVQSAKTAGFLAVSEENLDDKSEKSRSLSANKYKKEIATAAGYSQASEPLFRGGEIEIFKKYITDSIRKFIPEEIFNQTISVGFRITVSGKLENVKLINGSTSADFNRKLIKMMENSPVWSPATINGSPVAKDLQLEILLINN